jgi:hypothetical protein
MRVAAIPHVAWTEVIFSGQIDLTDQGCYEN